MVCLRLSSTNFIWSILESLDSYVGDLIYGIRLQVIVQDRLAKNIFQCFVKKKWISCRMEAFEKVVWIPIFQQRKWS